MGLCLLEKLAQHTLFSKTIGIYFLNRKVGAQRSSNKSLTQDTTNQQACRDPYLTKFMGPYIPEFHLCSSHCFKRHLT